MLSTDFVDKPVTLPEAALAGYQSMNKHGWKHDRPYELPMAPYIGFVTPAASRYLGKRPALTALHRHASAVVDGFILMARFHLAERAEVTPRQ